MSQALFSPSPPLSDDLVAEGPPGIMLKFDFSSRPNGASKGPVTHRERSNLKQAILDWLDEQV